MIGCDCRVCQSTDPRDRRSRPSILIEHGAAGMGAPLVADGGQSHSVDTSTDLRAQALALGMRRVDAILFTHSHADHILGLDEVRRFNVLQHAADSCLCRRTHPGGYPPDLRVHLRRGDAAGRRHPAAHAARASHGPFSLDGLESSRSRCFTAAADSRIPDRLVRISHRLQRHSRRLVAAAHGVRTLILDALRHRPASDALQCQRGHRAARRIGAERTLFTHICHDLPHAETCASLPAGIELAYDGQVLEIED